MRSTADRRCCRLLTLPFEYSSFVDEHTVLFDFRVNVSYYRMCMLRWAVTLTLCFFNLSLLKPQSATSSISRAS
jgi:hypothetical protein